MICVFVIRQLNYFLLMSEKLADNSGTKLFQREDIPFLLLFLLVLLILFSGNIFSGTYPLDPLWIEQGESRLPYPPYLRKCVLELRRFPLWWQGIAFGYPNLAHTHSTPLYPPLGFFYFLSFLTASTAYIIFHLVLLGCSFYFLLKRLKVSSAGAWFGASGLVTSAYIIANTGYHPFFLSLSWSPLIILVTIDLVRKITISRIMSLGILSALQFLSGDLELIAYQWTLVITASIAYGIIWRDRKISWFEGAGGVAFAGAIAILLVSVQFIPLIELFSQSDREVGFALLPIKGRVLEGIYRYADGLIRLIFPLTLAHHYYNISFVILALGLWGLIKADRRMRIFFIFILVFCYLNAVQHYSPMQRFFSLIPALKGFRFPSRLAFFVLASFCALASIGFDNLLREKPSKKFFMLVGAGLLVYAIVYYFYGPYRPIAIALIIIAVMGSFWGGFRSVFFQKSVSPKFSFFLFLLLFLFDPLLSSVKILPRTPKSAVEPFSEVVQVFREDARDESYPRSVIVDFFPEGRFRSGQEPGLGGFTIACFYSLYPKRYFWWHTLVVPSAFEFAENYSAVKSVSTYYFMFHYDQKNMLKSGAVPWLKLAGVKRLLLRGGICEFCSSEEPADYYLVHKGDVDIYETNEAYPRAFYAYRPIIFDDMKSVFNYMRANPQIDFREIVLLEKGYFAYYENYEPPKEDVLSPRIVEYLPDALTIDVAGNSGAYLILTDSYYPGWRAYVDGNERKIIPANGLFRALAVKEGDKYVSFKYQPISFGIGLWVSLVSGVVFLGVATFRRKFSQQ